MRLNCKINKFRANNSNDGKIDSLDSLNDLGVFEHAERGGVERGCCGWNDEIGCGSLVLVGFLGFGHGEILAVGGIYFIICAHECRSGALEALRKNFPPATAFMVKVRITRFSGLSTPPASGT